MACIFDQASQSLQCTICRSKPAEVPRRMLADPDNFIAFKEGFARRHKKCQGPAVSEIPSREVNPDAWWKARVEQEMRAALFQ